MNSYLPDEVREGGSPDHLLGRRLPAREVVRDVQPLPSTTTHFPWDVHQPPQNALFAPYDGDELTVM